MGKFKRDILSSGNNSKTIAALQPCLFDLIDLAMQGKQAHWNVVGPHFRSVHLQLDEIVDSVREISDEVAERIVTLGVAPDGRSDQVAKQSRLPAYPEGLQSDKATVTLMADRVAKTIEGLREAIQATDEPDPITQDLLIESSATLEKHLWMLQAQEV